MLHALEEIESVIDMVANFATDNLERSHRHKGSAKHVLLSCQLSLYSEYYKYFQHCQIK